ncbi:MAG: 50S ribosomal protein L17 [Candidatus Wildermuthbacteria bacterium]|nr:50S ribosomal protein L17 [Candidatus Wildermuthbacteria bacterium]
MKKRKAGRILSRKKSVRNALLISVMRALAQKEKVQLTEAKAKEIAPLMEHLVTKAKSDNLHARRELLRYFPASLVKKMLEEIGPRYRERQGGYTRVIKTIPRKSDGAKMAIVEFVK